MLQKEPLKFKEWYPSFLFKRDIDSTIVAGKNPQQQMRKYSVYGKICEKILESNKDKTTEEELISEIAKDFFVEEDTAKKKFNYAKGILMEFDPTIKLNFLETTNWESYGLHTFEEREIVRREIAEKQREKAKMIIELDNLNRELASKRLKKEVIKEELVKITRENWKYDDCNYVRTHPDIKCPNKDCSNNDFCKSRQKDYLEEEKRLSENKFSRSCCHCGRPTRNPKFCSDECRERSYKYKRELGKCLLKK